MFFFVVEAKYFFLENNPFSRHFIALPVGMTEEKMVYVRPGTFIASHSPSFPVTDDRHPAQTQTTNCDSFLSLMFTVSFYGLEVTSKTQQNSSSPLAYVLTSA